MAERVEAADEIERLTAENIALANNMDVLNKRVIQYASERNEAQVALDQAQRAVVGTRVVIDPQKVQIDRLVNGDKSPVAHAFQMRINALIAERDKARELLHIELAIGSAQNSIVNRVWDILGRDETREGGQNLVHRVQELADELSALRSRLAEYEQAPVVGWAYPSGQAFAVTTNRAVACDAFPGIAQPIPLIARPEPGK